MKNLDVRTPQVAIKAKIIFVDRTDIEELGLSYDLGTGNDQFFSQLVQRIDPSTRKPVDTQRRRRARRARRRHRRSPATSLLSAAMRLPRSPTRTRAS